jgi:large subunit ribosomal protein L35
MAQSLAEFGDMAGIVVNRRTGLLIGGHQRTDVLAGATMLVTDLPAPEPDGTVARGHLEHGGRRYAVRVVDWPEAKAHAALSCSCASRRTQTTCGTCAATNASPAWSEWQAEMKTKSSAKKRFKITGTGKVVYAQAGKRHGMIKRTNSQIRNLRGTAVMFDTDGYNVKKYFLPNG